MTSCSLKQASARHPSQLVRSRTPSRSGVLGSNSPRCLPSISAHAFQGRPILLLARYGRILADAPRNNTVPSPTHQSAHCHPARVEVRRCDDAFRVPSKPFAVSNVGRQNIFRDSSGSSRLQSHRPFSSSRPWRPATATAPRRTQFHRALYMKPHGTISPLYTPSRRNLRRVVSPPPFPGSIPTHTATIHDARWVPHHLRCPHSLIPRALRRRGSRQARRAPRDAPVRPAAEPHGDVEDPRDRPGACEGLQDARCHH